MKRIIVVDDMAVIREPIAAALRAAGYESICASGGKEALALIAAQPPDLVLLDLAMPEVDGMTVLRALRSAAGTASTPVMLLTGASDKEKVVEAAKLGVREYLLKSRFSLANLLARVAKQLGENAGAAMVSRADAAAVPQGDTSLPRDPAAAGHPVGASPRNVSALPAGIPQLLTRDDCLHRAREAMQSKTLSGVVAQVIAQAASPRVDTAQLAEMIGRDSMLSVRVLQAANSAAYASTKGIVTTIADAIRNIGCTAVRNIAATLGIFEAMPETRPDGFNPIRCWQHSFAVAQLCERLYAGVDPDGAGLAYLVGLCHDLGEILFHTHFGSEYRQVLDLATTTGRSREELERLVLGMTRGELVLNILHHIGLPDTIRIPVESLHAAGHTEPRDPLGRVLAVADYYANGALLASSPASAIAPLTQTTCKMATGNANPPAPDVEAIRNEVFSLTALLARLSTRDEQLLMQPLAPRNDSVVLLAREGAFSTFDPIATALGCMAQVRISSRLPDQEQLAGADALVVVARTPASPGFSPMEIGECLRSAGKNASILLWLADPEGMPQTTGLKPIGLKSSIEELAGFIHTASRSKLPAAAA